MNQLGNRLTSVDDSYGNIQATIDPLGNRTTASWTERTARRLGLEYTLRARGRSEAGGARGVASEKSCVRFSSRHGVRGRLEAVQKGTT
ncbi:MAG: hypothetical protein L0Y71_04570 [Gemmataceae bacterium]|nr:hypothetical protein [Gemmataceae bacterium]